MALVFLNVGGNTGTVFFAGFGQPNWLVDHGSFTVTADDSTPTVKDLMSNVNAHTYDAVMGTQPYLTATYNNADIIVTLHNAPVTPPTTATFSVLGNTYTETIANGQATFPITLHPAVSNQRVTVAIMVDGFTNIYVDAGGQGSNVEATSYQDASGIVHIAPSHNADLASYWQAQAMNPVWSQSDLATITGLNAYVLFHYVLPALTNGTYTPITLSADEQSGLADIQTHILPNIPSVLSVLTPVPPSGGTQTFDVHYSSFRAHLQSAKTAMDSYVADRLAITQHVQLK